MGKRMRQLLTLAIVVGIVVCAVGVVFYGRGFGARAEPSALEAFVARTVRRVATPRSAYDAVNPIALTPDILADARAHFADHCAICHANDGSGKTDIGRNLYPKAPDMRDTDTQSLTDGELFYIITNGIRLTGMPAWGSGDDEDDHDSWALVHFIRHLPDIADDELEAMGDLNPVSRSELAEAELEARFLQGEPEAQHDHHHHE